MSASISALYLLMISLSVSATPVQSTGIEQLRLLVNEQKYSEAYQVADKLADTQSGNTEFDFLYAMAAIKTGHPDYAIFALERLNSEYPDNGRIKIELARAYFLAGDDTNSRMLFEQVLSTSPPNNVVHNIHIFLDLIEQRESAQKSRLSGAIKLTAGWDSNYNSAPDLSVIQIGSLSFNLNDNSRQQSTYYSGVDANLAYHQYVNKTFYLDYGAYVQQRNNNGHDLDTLTTGVVVAPVILGNQSRYRIPVQYQKLNLDNDPYSSYASIGLEWTPLVNLDSQWTHFLQYGRLKYDNQPTRDMKMAILGTAYQFVTQKGNIYQTALFYNDQTSTHNNGKANEADTLGLRGYIKWPLSAHNAFYSKLLAESMKYGAYNPVFGITRDDKQFSASLGWEYKLNQSTVLAEAEYLKNSSNIDLYAYDRKSAFISLSYNFL